MYQGMDLWTGIPMESAAREKEEIPQINSSIRELRGLEVETALINCMSQFVALFHIHLQRHLHSYESIKCGMRLTARRHASGE